MVIIIIIIKINENQDKTSNDDSVLKSKGNQYRDNSLNRNEKLEANWNNRGKMGWGVIIFFWMTLSQHTTQNRKELVFRIDVL